MPLKPHCRIFFAICSFIVFSFQTASAQKLRFTQLGIQQGLPASEVYNLHQDNNGYVWAFTQYGIAKHNGQKFVPACSNIAFDDKVVFAVTQSPQGEMFFANSKAYLYRVQNDSAFRLPGTDSISEQISSAYDAVFDLNVKSAHDIHFSTYKFSCHYLNGKTIPLTDTQTQKDTGIICLLKTQTGFTVLHYNKTELDHYKISIKNDQHQFSLVTTFHDAWGSRIRLKEANNRYYLMKKEQVICLDAAGKIIATAPVKGVITIEVAPDGNIWLGTLRGLFMLDPMLQVKAHYFDGSLVSDILFDQHNGIWISTLGQGIFYSRSIYESFYDQEPGLLGNISLLKKLGNRLFIGTTGGELFVNDHHDSPVKIGLGDPYGVNAIDTFGDHYLIGTKGDIFTYSRELKHVNRQYTGHRNWPANSYGFARKNADTMIVISGGAILTLSSGNYNLATNELSTHTRNRSIVKRNANEFFIGTNKGLYLFSDSFYIPSYLKPLSNVVISRLRTDDQKQVWICTRGHGLFILSPRNKLKKWNDCPSEVINDVLPDSAGVLLCTNKGLFRHMPQNAAWFRLLADEASSCEIWNDKIYVATQQGLISLNRQQLRANFDPVVQLASVYAGDTRISEKNIRLTYDQHDLHFNFDILSYHNTDLSFIYTLEHAGESWQINERGPLHLQHLGPGSYILHVAVSDNAGNIRTDIVHPVLFDVMPAFWQTIPFKASVVAGLLLLIILLMRYNHNRIRKREQAKVLIIRELAQYRLTALKAQINPHFVSNSLTAVQHLVIDNEIDRANLYIAQFSRLIRYALEYSDQVLTTLANEIEVIDIIVALEKLRFSDHFVYEKQIDETISTYDVLVPPLITQPIIENAIWHGLLPLNGSRTPKLSLTIKDEQQKLTITIADNGVGRQVPSPAITGKSSRGADLISSWIDNLNRLLPEPGAFIHYTDLYDEENKPAGTRVDIILHKTLLHNLSHENTAVPYH